MKSSIRSRLAKICARLEEVNILLSMENATVDMDNFRRLSREHSDLTPLSEAYSEFLGREKSSESAKEMLNDPELRELAEEELQENSDRLNQLDLELQRMLLPKDANDDKNIYLEIRAGAGGDESGLFVGDLYRMYLRYAERMGWKAEVITESATGIGGFKEIIVKLEGSKVYSRLKFESGGHRVQRVPDTETQGRVHTSACTVAILPEADEVEDIQISNEELRIDTYRASGAGGQHVNKTDSAVRVTHLPTGIVVECQEDRSQHKNRARALAVLSARLKDKKISEQQEQEAATRKSLVGSGDRSQRIRTYNFPQGRLTDHRINLTLYKLQDVIDGDMDELIEALLLEHQAYQLAELVN